MLLDIQNKEEWQNLAANTDELLGLFFYTDSSQDSQAVLKELREIVEQEDSYNLALVNASKVRDIHPEWGVSAVPTLLGIKNGQVVKKLEGKQTNASLLALWKGAVQSSANAEGAKGPEVFVYTTPTCPHCTTVKSYFSKQGIPFVELDVSSDQAAADRMTAKSGQAGVPQIEINGTMVVGANLPQINKLLGI